MSSFRYCKSEYKPKSSTSSFLSRELEAVGQAMVNASIELKAAMTKAVLTALSGFNDMVNNMEIKTKTLLQDRVRVGTFIKYTQ